ncbi:ABC transporter permease [Ancylomarina euxinus]|uniref:ABC transporter permease n=1 Tax=Ancylomarina euxinus TaxID=2283627 RepID=A0A425Y5I4_9BACT|nr:ABC transporter permease [Ancylomarina euxinus]MCZ4694311.1 ABC transporter permease [Ancylomarina euxinus]MUP14358.1 FtsX-like permease family protein [Ancylomarina euxinus]RRG23670.1 ABC transporter permease [Ancylomarina euxinus]
MLKIFLNTVFRKLYLQKGYSLINILGLATGITCSLLILLWVEYELSFDSFHDNKSQIYSVYENQTYADGEIFTVYATPAPLAIKLKEDISEIDKATRISRTWGKLMLTIGGSTFIEGSGLCVDTDFFKMFSFSVLLGDPNLVMPDERSIVITEKMSKKYFGETNPLGKVISINSNINYHVSAVLKDSPKNSSLYFDYLLPFNFIKENWSFNLNNWDSHAFLTLIQVKKKTYIPGLETIIKPYIKQNLEQSNADLALQPFTDYHLHSISGKKLSPILYVRIFSLVAFIILLIACFNYMNLSTARSERRAREVAVRKVVGAHKRGLFALFMAESIFISLLAFGLAIVSVELLLPFFKELTQRDLSLKFSDTTLLLSFAAIVLFTGFISGSYPALYLSSFKPIRILKGKLYSDSHLFRKLMVIIQFTISVGLIISTSIIYKQLDYLQDKDVGYQKDNIIYIEMMDDFHEHYSHLKENLIKIPGVLKVTAANQMPINFSNSTSDVSWKGKSTDADNTLFQLSFVDYDFIETFEMEVIHGRAFSSKQGGDSLKLIINEAAASAMKMSYTIGQKVKIWEYDCEVIGIVKDFNFNSLQVGVKPLIMLIISDEFKYIAIKTDGNEQPIINKIGETWKKCYPKIPFSHRLLRDDFSYLYKAESRMSSIFIAFTLIAIIISSLGLFGLSSYIIEQKFKEMGIRKVFGAEFQHLFKSFLIRFLRWILLANLIAWPTTYFLMQWWLAGFAYRIHISWFEFLGAGLLSILIAFITVFYQTYKISSITPIKAIRYE